MPTTITAYTFDELSPEAQERALRDVPFDDCEHTASECADSLRAFAEKVSRSCGVTLKDWSIGDLQRSFTKWDMDDAVRELAGPRSLAWIENNIFAVVRRACVEIEQAFETMPTHGIARDLAEAWMKTGRT